MTVGFWQRLRQPLQGLWGQKNPIADPPLPESIDWHADVVADNEEVYQSLVRAIARTQGFGLFFVRCVEQERVQLEQRLRQDLPKLHFESLALTEDLPDGNLYQRVAAVVQQSGPLAGVLISGLEKSLDPYVKSGYGGLGDYYNKDLVPRVLGHLNLQRERFRDDFPFCLVFFLSAFGLKFIARRAPDWFDWRSGLFEFVPEAADVEQLTLKAYGDYEQYLEWSETQRLDRIRELQALIDEDHQTSEGKAGLFWEKGKILAANQSHEEAIASYDKALEIKPDDHRAWNNRGVALGALNRHEEAIASYDKALELNPDVYLAWYNRGVALGALNRYEEAIASYDKALELKDYHLAWYDRACAYALLGAIDLAFDDLAEAIRLNPEKYQKLAVQDPDLAQLREDPRFQILLNKHAELKGGIDPETI